MVFFTKGSMNRIRKSVIDDTLAAGIVLETGAITAKDMIDGLASQIKRLSGEADWHASPVANLSTLNTTVATVSNYKQLYFTEHAANVVLSNNVATLLTVGEFPVGTLRVGASIALGIVAGQTASPTGVMSPVAGLNPTHPKNLCMIVDSVTGNELFAAISGNRIQGLLATVANEGTASSATNTYLQMVELNATGDGFVFAQVSDVSGKTINYAYPRREISQNIPEDAHLNSNFSEGFAAVDVNLGAAYANQVGDVVQAGNININIADTKVWELFDSAGIASILQVAPNVADDAILMGGDRAVVNSTLFDSNAATNNFLAGATVGSGSANALSVGVTTGQLGSVGALTLKAGTDLLLDDANRIGSGWAAAGVKVAAVQQEWIDAKANFGGEFSLLKMLSVAKNSSSRTKTSAFVNTTIVAGTNVTFGTNLTAQLGDYSAVASFKDNVDVYLSGKLLIGGNAAGTDIDVYPGTLPANGDLKFTGELEFDSISDRDALIMIING